MNEIIDGSRDFGGYDRGRGFLAKVENELLPIVMMVA